MKLHCLVFGICAASLAHAFGDLTIVQSVEGMGPVTQMTMKIKGDKARIDVSPQIATIFDGKTGEMINLMRDQKMVVRMSAEKIKLASEMMQKSKPQKKARKNQSLSLREKKKRSTVIRLSNTFTSRLASKRHIGLPLTTRMALRFLSNFRRLRWMRSMDQTAICRTIATSPECR